MTKRLLPLLFLYLSCSLHAAPAQELAKLRAKVMAADYRGDLAELARLRDEIAARKDDGELAYLDRYWSGFASWRLAINGTNHNMKGDELASNLRAAASDFYQSIRLKEDFADGYAAASMVNGWLAVFDEPGRRERVSLAQALFVRATKLDASNPRVLWCKGSFFLYPKPEQGGSVPKAIEVYQQMLKEAERRGVDAASPLPDWGKPEALMSLAFAHSMLAPPDLDTASSEASAALKAVPEWSYVRDILMPMLEKQRSGQTAH